LTTWTSPNGQQQRQIDYIMINHKYRNTVSRAWAIQGWKGNAQQQRQHTVIRMDITPKLLQKYHQPNIRETGKYIQYGKEEMKLHPDKLAKWYKQRFKEQDNTTYENNNKQKTQKHKKYGKIYKTTYYKDSVNATHLPTRKKSYKESSNNNKVNTDNGDPKRRKNMEQWKTKNRNTKTNLSTRWIHKKSTKQDTPGQYNTRVEINNTNKKTTKSNNKICASS